MAFLTVSGESGCRTEDAARSIAHRLKCELLTETRLDDIIASEFGAAEPIPDKAWRHVATSIAAGMATRQNVVLCAAGAELLFRNYPSVLRIYFTAPLSRRIGNVMIDQRLERPEAKELLIRLAAGNSALRKQRFGKALPRPHEFDLIVSAEAFTLEQATDLVEAAIQSRRFLDDSLFSAAADAQVQFQARLQLAKFGMVPPDRVRLERKDFVHPSEEIFANLLDFYRIDWEYEPRSFPLQWDKDGKPTEAFTPDFYLPEFDLYVELTTMKQTLVTRKNRKVRLLRAIYPHVNIQVFYQRDFQDLILKYGIGERSGS